VYRQFCALNIELTALSCDEQKLISTLLKELDEFARNGIKDELASLDPLLRNTTLEGRDAYEFEGVLS
jgi:hypothetical protein